MAECIRKTYDYQVISTLISVKIPSLTNALLENDQQYDSIMGEINSELRKFGELRQFYSTNPSVRSGEVFMPRPRDLNIYTTIKESALGKAYAEFLEITSAFACYNLLHGRSYMG